MKGTANIVPIPKQGYSSGSSSEQFVEVDKMLFLGAGGGRKCNPLNF